MADIFISYAREDETRIGELVRALEKQGWSIFWDRRIPAGKTWESYIEQYLGDAKCVIVAWSQQSINSKWVKIEATEAEERHVLVPVLLDRVKPPLAFRDIQAADLVNWDPAQSSPEFEKLIADISLILGPPPRRVKEAEQAAEEERKRNQEEERKRKEEEKRKAEEESQRLEIEKRRIAEEEQKRAEVKRKAEEERKGKEAQEEEELAKQAQAKQKAEAQSKFKQGVAKEAEIAAIETEKKEQVPVPKASKESPLEYDSTEISEPIPRQPEPTKLKLPKTKPDAKVTDAPITPEQHKKSNFLKFSVVLGVILILIAGIWWFISELEKGKIRVNQQQQKLAEPETSERTKPPIKKTQSGKIFVEGVPENAAVRILNVDQSFHQGMELEPGRYHVEVSLQDYETQDRWIDLNANEEKRIKFDLKKIVPRVGRFYVEVIPNNAVVKILNIKAKFYQGMELEAGSYQVEVASEGYETQRQWIKLEAGYEKPFKFELAKVKIPEPTQVQKVIKNTIGMEFVLIRPEAFVMGGELSAEEVVKRYGGKEEWFKDEHPQHKVILTKGFYLGVTEVTVGQWRKFAQETGYKSEAEVQGNAWGWSQEEGKWKEIKGLKWSSPGYEQTDRHPVTCVSWNDAQAFIKWLNGKGEGRYQLPTEAEWEYACRAGTNTSFYTGDTEKDLDQAGWYWKNSGGRTYPVGEKKPNAWGLYDMHGNVWEWVEDDWHGSYKGAPDDGSAWNDNPRGSLRVVRGGGWSNVAHYCRSATRTYGWPGDRRINVGFRLSRSVALGP